MPAAFGHAKTLSSSLGDLSDVISDARSAYTNGHVAPSTFHSVVELSALQVHSLVEAYLEELFLSCLMGESGIEVDRLVAPVSRANALSLLSGATGRDVEYLTWLPLDQTLGRAARVFRFGRPFSRLAYRPAVTTSVRELITVRNAVAHPSQIAHRKLVDLGVSKGYAVSRPADFLLAVRDGCPEIDNFVAMMIAVGTALAEPAEGGVEVVLALSGNSSRERRTFRRVSMNVTTVVRRSRSTTSRSYLSAPARSSSRPVPHVGRHPLAQCARMRGLRELHT